MNPPRHGIDWLAEASVRELIQGFPLPIAVLDDTGSALILNDRFARIYGAEALASAPLQALIRNSAPGWHTVKVAGGGVGQVAIRAQVLRVQGMPMLIFDDAPGAGLLRELDLLRGKVAELERLSSTDPLTGAWNRAHFERVIAAEMDRSIRYRQPVSLVLVDIDHFKRINDTYGHQAGDAVLCELVELILTTVRSGDPLFRWGGEEFVVLASSTGYRAGATLAEKLRATVEQHRFAGVGAVTISLGVAEHIASESAKVWFQRADAALYQAKDGRNRACVDRCGSSDMWAQASGASVIRLVWQEAYECGEPMIDREHRELFDLANVLLDASFASAASPQAFSAALEQLLAHIAQHFAHEEAVLARHAYNGLEAHRRAHSGLLARAGELKAAAAAGTVTLGDLVEFLANTVVAQHLFKADQEYFPLFKSGNGALETLLEANPQHQGPRS